nr:MAG TPA: hypothetical protein [Crassvirales sp.]
MTTPEMHIMFRQYAQQMGMQNTRAILPEQIDLLINTSIMDTVNEIIKQNIGITNDRVITDNSKIGQINALRSLYHVSILDMSPSDEENVIFAFSAADSYTGRMTTNNMSSVLGIQPYMFLVDFSLNYKKSKVGYTDSSTEYTPPIFEADALVTNFFPVRIIDDTFLADTLNDFVLKPRLRSPIIVTYNSNNRTNVFDLYIDKFIKDKQNHTYYLTDGLLPYQLRMSYIAKPAVVAYREDVGGTNVDCDLPEYMHVDIVKHAVDLYRIAVSGSVMAAQAQEQNARQENMRNNYRNEGNAQQQ